MPLINVTSPITKAEVKGITSVLSKSLFTFLASLQNRKKLVDLQNYKRLLRIPSIYFLLI